jgi:hypothetical protein
LPWVPWFPRLLEKNDPTVSLRFLVHSIPRCDIKSAWFLQKLAPNQFFMDPKVASPKFPVTPMQPTVRPTRTAIGAASQVGDWHKQLFRPLCHKTTTAAVRLMQSLAPFVHDHLQRLWARKSLLAMRREQISFPICFPCGQFSSLSSRCARLSHFRGLRPSTSLQG